MSEVTSKTKVTTIYGEYGPKELKSIKGSLDELVLLMSSIKGKKEEMKAIFDAIHESHNLPAKFTRRLAKVHYNNSFKEEVAQDSEFEVLYANISEAQ
jgi:hypothetical protein